MAESFFQLNDEERKEVLQRGAVESGIPEDVLEKDVWLVWTLDKLFTMPNAPEMAFKGGTALSKVFGAIERFSEDVDVSIDYRSLAPDLAECDFTSMSKTAKKKISDNLRNLLKNFSIEVLVPYLQTTVDNLVGKGVCLIDADDNGEKVWLKYPAVAAKMGYLRDEVLIEFGGRNPTEPNDARQIACEISRIFPQFDWPTATATVLHPARTFWEKATLIHIECSRAEPKLGDRMFRHWYDLAKLGEHAIGADAIGDIPLLERVVQHKEVFYAYSNVGYEGCLSGKLKLVPGDVLMGTLRGDHKRMIEQRMFYGAGPNFDEVIDRIRTLEAQINEIVGERTKKLLPAKKSASTLFKPF